MSSASSSSRPRNSPDRALPAVIESESQLNNILTQPTDALVESIKQVRDPLIVLGASGKMGPSLCVLAKRAADLAGHRLSVIAASRFSASESRTWLEQHGVQTHSCDLLDPEAIFRLPESDNVIYLVGLKFGTQQTPWLTWAANTLPPDRVARKYKQARMVALSTGNVYPFVGPESGGATETSPLAPIGEYAWAALARERLFEFYSRASGIPLCILRLNYAVELRYGVLLEIAQSVWRGDEIDLGTGHFNCIWQRDANAMILQSLALASTPPAIFNLTGPTVLSVREIAEAFGKLLGKPVRFTGVETGESLLSNSQALCRKLGPPETPLATVLEWTAHWVCSNGSTLNKPTHFGSRTGQY